MTAGRWPSPLDATRVATAGLRLAQPSLHGGWSHWLEGRPNEGGRVALLRARDGVREELAPAPLSVRTRVHEYGGGAYLACDAGTFFVAEGFVAEGILADDAPRGSTDGALWWWRPAEAAGAPRGANDGARGTLTLLAAVPGLRFADLCWDAQRERLLCVIEDTRADPHRPRNTIGAVALVAATLGAVCELLSGRDFYAAPRVAPDGATLAFLAWDLPAMPWDGATLEVAALDAAGNAAVPITLAGPAAFQPEFAPDGALWWSDDADGCFVLARAATPLAGPAGPAIERFPDLARECALPLWNLNMRSFGFADAQTVVAASVAEGLWQLRALDIASGAWRPLADDLTQIDQVHAAEGVALVLGGGPRLALGVQQLTLSQGQRRTLSAASALALEPAALSMPEPVRFVGSDGDTVHALWWPPASATHALGPGERPPLLLRCHGGPTAAAQSALEARTLFWTTRGFAVLDLNYRGSWGFGRDYRRALDGRWGELDAADAIAAARWAIASGRADPARLAITGSSAGGLTALNALRASAAGPTPFRSAAIHYGLAELISAMTDTHKFESGYGETLLGPWPAARAVYERRSPLTALTAAGASAFGWPPTILFQGADDRVVLPDQSTRLAEALRALGVPVELHLYPGEGHGFRRADTVIDVLERELTFHLQSHLAVVGVERSA